ncbi:caprin-2-like [Pseudoliparis swirei]|uniref:caprin-2-like n=1 Tax=Pseudoliparis swirei TaxID=2059687 RepID=UPI0024BD8642|nr:caprin-2-like [Pseudoliparis swirei]
MNFAIFLFVLPFCGLTLAQKSNDAIVVEKITERQTCYPDMCEILKEFGAMTEKMRAMETRLKESETRLKDSETQILELKNQDFGAMTEKMRAMETRLKDSETRLTESETRLTECETQILELRNKERTKVAFSAAIGGESRAIGPFTTDKTLIYKREITNIGSAYSTFSGIFTAPIAGVYYFTFSYHAGGNNLVHLNLYKNNQVLVTAFDHQTVYDNADNGGNAVFVQLQQGDQVFVRLVANTHIWGNDALSTFSGCLVVE